MADKTLSDRVSALEIVLQMHRDTNRLEHLEGELGRRVRWLIGLQILQLTTLLGGAAAIVAAAI